MPTLANVTAERKLACLASGFDFPDVTRASERQCICKQELLSYGSEGVYFATSNILIANRPGSEIISEVRLARV